MRFRSTNMQVLNKVFSLNNIHAEYYTGFGQNGNVPGEILLYLRTRKSLDGPDPVRLIALKLIRE